MRIALVEDNPADARLMERALYAAGVPIEIVWLQDGVEALEYLSNSAGDVDLVLLDLNLPRLTGMEILERLRQQEEFRTLPIVVMSGSSDPADIERCYRASANSYFCKPVHVDEIFAMASKLIHYWSASATAGKRSHKQMMDVPG